MKAIIITGYGRTDMLKIAEQPKPPITKDQVLIQVKTASVNPIDWRIRSGSMSRFIDCEFPVIPGREVAGVVTEIGENVKNFAVGDEVFGFLQQSKMKWGSYAEYVPADSYKLAHKPSSLSFEQAVSIPVSFHTAQQSLFKNSGLQSGQTVLIHAAAGAVGSMAVQLAHSAGATVLATASSYNHEYVLGLGADKVVDYNNKKFGDLLKSEYPGGVDVILAPFAGQSLQGSEVLVSKKTHITLLSPVPEPEDMKIGPVKSHRLIVQAEGSSLEKISSKFTSGQLKVKVARVFPLEQAAEAQNLSETEHVQG
ncbi:MAG: NADP-dependent oxidoreductase, partial [Bacteroidetes bacterium]